jgi:hypothetical protein
MHRNNYQDRIGRLRGRTGQRASMTAVCLGLLLLSVGACVGDESANLDQDTKVDNAEEICQRPLDCSVGADACPAYRVFDASSCAPDTVVHERTCGERRARFQNIGVNGQVHFWDLATGTFVGRLVYGDSPDYCGEVPSLDADYTRISAWGEFVEESECPVKADPVNLCSAR